RVCDRLADALLRKRIDGLHVEPGIFVAGAVEHLDTERQIIGGETPGSEHVEVLGADAVPGRLDRAGVSELAHLDIGAAVAQHLHALGSGAWMTRAIHHEVRAESADDVAHFSDTFLRRLAFLDVDGGLGAEFARELQARLFRRADADHPARAHLLRSRDGQNSDRTGALDHHGVAPGEAAGAHGAIESADA